MLKIGYFADGPWSHNAFERLVKDSGIKILFVCVRFDTTDLTLKEYCCNYDIPYIKNKNINSAEFISAVKKFNCDLFVSMSFNQIFKKEIINLPKYKIINCHAGKLPFYRGRNILNWALINDEKEFGITVHFVDQGIDTGDILLQRTYPISDNDDYASLLETSYVECASVLCDAVDMFKKGNVHGVAQNTINSVGFYCNQRRQGDELLNWDQSSREVFNFIRAISKPGPMARTFINGKEMSVNKIELIKDAHSYKCSVGVVLNKEKDSFYVKTHDSFVKVTEFYFEGTLKVGDRFDVK